MHPRHLFLLAIASFASAQDLDDSYTLGRITAPNEQFATMLDSRYDVTVIGAAFDYRMGTANSWSLDLPVAYARASKGDNGVSVLQLPGARLSLHPVPSLILDGILQSANLWVATSNVDGATGFDSKVPKILRTDLFGHYLSNEGRISLRE